MEINKLNDISKTAAIAVASSLSKMIGKPVGVDISPAKTVSADQFPSIIEPDHSIIGITAPLSGDLQGLSLFFFTKDTAMLLCDFLMRRNERETQELKDVEISALTEVANIIVGNFLVPFAAPLQLDTLMHHVPKLRCDTYKNIMKFVNDAINDNVKDRCLIEVTISMQHRTFKGYFVVILSMDQIKNVLEKQ